MAAPGATFRRLLPLSRPLLSRPLAAAAARPYGVRASGTGELVTHTGQVYEEKDYRRARFVGRQKEGTGPSDVLLSAADFRLFMVKNMQGFQFGPVPPSPTKDKF